MPTSAYNLLVWLGACCRRQMGFYVDTLEGIDDYDPEEFQARYGCAGITLRGAIDDLELMLSMQGHVVDFYPETYWMDEDDPRTEADFMFISRPRIWTDKVYEDNFTYVSFWTDLNI